MGTSAEILAEESKIVILKERVRNLFVPRKSINFQFRNLRYGNRNQLQTRIITQRKRARVLKQISSSEARIDLLRSNLPAPIVENGI